MIVADTSFFIALFRRSDALHKRAEEIMRKVRESQQMMLATTHVIDETVSYLRKRDDSEKAYSAAKLLLGAKNISIETVARTDLENSAEIMRKYEKLSLCDALSVELGRKHGISQIISFDSGFDHVERISRVF